MQGTYYFLTFYGDEDLIRSLNREILAHLKMKEIRLNII